MESKRVILVKDFKMQPKYEFELKDKKYKVFIEREYKDNLVKWNIDTGLKLLTYSSHLDVESRGMNQIITNVLQSENVRNDLGWQILKNSGTNEGTDIRIEVETVPCTILSMEFFDRIYERNITLPDGTIRKCFEDYIDDIVIADELRTMLLVEESDNYLLFQEKERAEFLFRIFKHMCIGGLLNQYEDNIEPYLSISKALYKDILCVRKIGASKTPTIISKVFKITCNVSDTPVVPSKKLHEQDFVYVILNSKLHEVTILCHVW